MKTKKIFLSLLCAIAMSINGIAQDPAKKGFILDQVNLLEQDLGQTMTFASTEMGFDTKIIKGAPFSAEIINEFTQVLQDGNRIERITKGSLYRDSEGRTRRETEFRLPFRNKTSDESSEPQRNISIFDAVSGETAFFNPSMKTFRSTGLRAPIKGVSVGSASASSTSEGPNALFIRRGGPVKRVPPVYPEAARAAGAVGSVKVQVTISDDGKVIEAKALSGHPLLREAATDAAKQWEFSPVEAHDKAINKQITLGFEFSDVKNNNATFTTSAELGNTATLVVKKGSINSDSFPSSGITALATTIGLPDNVPAFARGDIRKESLGTQMIEGIEAEGTRIVSTIPAGAMGNIGPIEVISERWYSPKLQTVIMSKTVDPRIGTTIYRLTNINQGEPDSSLFKIPEEHMKEK